MVARSNFITILLSFYLFNAIGSGVRGRGSFKASGKQRKQRRETVEETRGML